VVRGKVKVRGKVGQKIWNDIIIVTAEKRTLV
jgi:hypothetical protein